MRWAALALMLGLLVGCNDEPDPCEKFDAMIAGDPAYDDLGMREWQKQNEQAYEACMEQMGEKA